MSSDTAITNCHSDTTIFQLRAHWSIGSEKSFGQAPRLESNPRLPAFKASTLIYNLQRNAFVYIVLISYTHLDLIGTKKAFFHQSLEKIVGFFYQTFRQTIMGKLLGLIRF